MKVSPRSFDWLFAATLIGLAASSAAEPAAELHDLVCINTFIPSIVVELPYATKENFFHRQFYPENRAWLLRPVADRLAKVQAELEQQGLGLKLWDGYRPLAIQRELWKVMPDPRYVADPSNGSRHNRGAAVDITLVDRDGKEIPMPTAYDDFSPRAAANYLKVTAEVAANRSLLQKVMQKHGFRPLPSEWWHFDAVDWDQHPVLDVPVTLLYAATATAKSSPGPPPASEPVPLKPVPVERRILDLEERVRTLERTLAELRQVITERQAANANPEPRRE